MKEEWNRIQKLAKEELTIGTDSHGMQIKIT
jgi:hypothetical protein